MNIPGVGNIMGVWNQDPNAMYTQGDIVVHNNDIYVCIAQQAMGSALTNPSAFQPLYQYMAASTLAEYDSATPQTLVTKGILQAVLNRHFAVNILDTNQGTIDLDSIQATGRYLLVVRNANVVQNFPPLLLSGLSDNIPVFFGLDVWDGSPDGIFQVLIRVSSSLTISGMANRKVGAPWFVMTSSVDQTPTNFLAEHYRAFLQDRATNFQSSLFGKRFDPVSGVISIPRSLEYGFAIFIVQQGPTQQQVYVSLPASTQNVSVSGALSATSNPNYWVFTANSPYTLVRAFVLR
ncbi:MAG: hypothetical protein QW815_06570 [Nitrososphaerota archaeon]